MPRFHELTASYPNLSRKPIILWTVLVAAAACVSAPVQEMSDARQAIRAAENAGAAQRASSQLDAAYQLLKRAQRNLESGDYSDARRFAVDAKEKAVEARQQAEVESR